MPNNATFGERVTFSFMPEPSSSIAPSKNYLGIIISLFLLVSAAWQQGWLMKIQTWWNMRPYEQQIAACNKEKAMQFPGEHIIGLDYDCALQVGKTIQTTNPAIALQLCMDHRPFALEDNLQAAACRSSLAMPTASPITVHSSPTSSSTPLRPEIVTYENTKYAYQFSYPKTYRIVNNDDYTSDIKQSSSIAIYDGNHFLFEVQALDPELLKKYSGWESTIARREGSLADYAQFIQEKNKTTNYLEPSMTTKIDGHVAYEFWMKDKFNNGDAEITIPENEAKFFVKPHDIIFEISFPLGSSTSSDIFETIQYH